MFFKNMDALQQIRKPIEAEMSQYKQVFDSYLVHTNPLLNRVLNTIGNRRGKMMRPMLTLLIAKLAISSWQMPCFVRQKQEKQS